MTSEHKACVGQRRTATGPRTPVLDSVVSLLAQTAGMSHIAVALLAGIMDLCKVNLSSRRHNTWMSQGWRHGRVYLTYFAHLKDNLKRQALLGQWAGHGPRYAQEQQPVRDVCALSPGALNNPPDWTFGAVLTITGALVLGAASAAHFNKQQLPHFPAHQDTDAHFIALMCEQASQEQMDVACTRWQSYLLRCVANSPSLA
eukprot:scaffold82040_cov24-Tisochrysis_lutea.AAC.1